MVAGAAILIVTLSMDAVHGLLLMVHLNTTLDPTVIPVNVDAGSFSVVMVAVPDTMLQAPVPTAGMFAANVVLVTLHNPWSTPALAVVGRSDTPIVTSSLLLPQPPLLMVHLKVTLLPIVNPVIPEVANVGVVIVAVPDVTVHKPLPVVAVVPAKV